MECTRMEYKSSIKELVRKKSSGNILTITETKKKDNGTKNIGENIHC